MTSRYLLTSYDQDEAFAIAKTIERILAERPRLEVPWPSLHLALRAVYLGKDYEAQQLMQDALKYADRLRKELIATMDYNWSHYEVVLR